MIWHESGSMWHNSGDMTLGSSCGVEVAIIIARRGVGLMGNEVFEINIVN